MRSQNVSLGQSKAALLNFVCEPLMIEEVSLELRARLGCIRPRDRQCPLVPPVIVHRLPRLASKFGGQTFLICPDDQPRMESVNNEPSRSPDLPESPPVERKIARQNRRPRPAQ